MSTYVCDYRLLRNFLIPDDPIPEPEIEKEVDESSEQTQTAEEKVPLCLIHLYILSSLVALFLKRVFLSHCLPFLHLPVTRCPSALKSTLSTPM